MPTVYILVLPPGLTIADPPGEQKLKYHRVYSHHFHTTSAESIHTTPNSIQCPFKGALYRIQILCRRYTFWSYPAGLTIAGDSLVFIFPLAPMLTFTSAVGKLNVRVLWHHRMLLQVISQSYCQVFVKSYNFVFEKIDKEGSPREK